MELIRHYAGSFPRDDLVVQRTTPGTVLQKLLDGEGDIALTLRSEIANSKIRRNLQYHFLESGERRVIFSPDHPLAKKKVITLEDMYDYEVMYPTYESETSEKWVGNTKRRAVQKDTRRFVPIYSG